VCFGFDQPCVAVATVTIVALVQRLLLMVVKQQGSAQTGDPASYDGYGHGDPQ